MAVSLQDLLKGLDPTGFTGISGSQIAQLIDDGTPYTDKGLTILTTDTAGVPDVPDAATTTKWKRYLWIRQMATTTKVYAWDDTRASDATYLKWLDLTDLSIGVGSITNSMLFGGITEDKIVSLPYSKVSGPPTSLPPSGAAGGDLAGTYPNPAIGAGKVLSTALAVGVGYKFLQTVITTNSTRTDGTLALPFDNNAMTSAQGFEYSALNTSITPILTTSKLLVEVLLWCGTSAVNTSEMMRAGVFRDTDSPAKGEGMINIAGTQMTGMKFYAQVTSGALTTTTFKVRIAAVTANNASVNGTQGSAKGGGGVFSWLRVSEIISP